MPRPDFRIAVSTRFLPEQSSAADDVYAFAYTITIRNDGDATGQVIARHWVITHGSGQVDEVRGLGIVGEQPLLRPGEQHEYSSWTRISTPRGRMHGVFFCISEDARWFEAPIAPFDLAVAQALH
jgi:ApaG protein